MRVLLVNPATRRYLKENGEVTCKNATMPMGIAHIAAYIREQGYEVGILDVTLEGYDHEVRLDANNIRYGLSPQEIRSRIEAYRPDVVGVTCIQSMRYYEAQEIVRITKDVDAKIVTVMGGTHVTGLPELCVSDLNLDFAVIGEGELVFHRLLKALEDGGDLSAIPGVARRVGGEVQINPERLYIHDFDAMPMPAWDLLPMESYFRVGVGPSQHMLNRYAILVTSRGCPHQCYYCPSFACWGGKYRALSPDKVFEQIAHLNHAYQVETILFEEHNFISHRKRVLRICELLRKSGLNITWSVPNGMEVSHLDYDYIGDMAASGCNMLHLAIETTTQAVYDRLDKRMDYDHARQVIQWGKRFGMKVVTLFMLGFPEESKEDMERTIDYAERLDPDYVHFFIATPLPGTSFYKECLDTGFLQQPVDFSRLRYNLGNISTQQFSSTDVERYRREGWLRIMGGKIARGDVWGNPEGGGHVTRMDVNSE
jgi:magnesium-protoporphyrin IX monomethyl ester (oxidative) cyclase